MSLVDKYKLFCAQAIESDPFVPFVRKDCRPATDNDIVEFSVIEFIAEL